MSETTSTRITDHAGLLASIPHMFGFVPEKSLVGVFIADNKVVVSMRMDLDLYQPDAVVERALMAAYRSSAEDLILIAYGESLDQQTANSVVSIGAQIELAEAAPGKRPVRLIDAIQVDLAGGQWRRIIDGWDAEVRPWQEVLDHPVNAARIFEGSAVAPTRASLGEAFEPGSEAAPKGFGRGFKTTMQIMAEIEHPNGVARTMAGLLDELGDPEHKADGWQLGQLVALGTDLDVVEVCCARLTRETAEHWFQLWSRAARVSSGSAAFLPLIMAGLAAWLMGDGSRMNVAGEMAEQIHPGHFLVKMTKGICDNALPPAEWEGFRAQLTTWPEAS